MITKQEPAQPKLWSRFQDLLSEAALEELDRGWQGVFRRMILKQLPVELMEEKFNKYTGRPTKELYSVCGLLLIMNYFVEGVFIPWGCIKLFFARKHRSFGVYYNAARLRLYINYSIRHAGESDYRNEQQTSERDDDTAERLYA